MNRRGVHAAYLVAGFILLALVLLASIMVFLAVKDTYERTEDGARCAAQIRTHAAAVRATGELKAPAIVCPTREVTVTPDDDARKVIADELRSCWDMWGRGELRLFGNADGAYCHVCATVTVAEPVTGLPAYLAENGYTEKMAGVKSGDAFRDERFPEIADVTIPSDKPIGIVFYYAKGLTFWDGVRNAVIGEPPRATGTGAALGVAAGIGVVYVASAFTGGVPLIVTGALSIAGGAATGAGAGFIMSIAGRADLDTLAVAVVRPLDTDDIRGLGCTYAPVANS